MREKVVFHLDALKILLKGWGIIMLGLEQMHITIQRWSLPQNLKGPTNLTSSSSKSIGFFLHRSSPSKFNRITPIPNYLPNSFGTLDCEL